MTDAVERREAALTDAAEELAAEVAKWLAEQRRGGLDLPEGFEERAGEAVAVRAREVFERLAFRCFTAGVDS